MVDIGDVSRTRGASASRRPATLSTGQTVRGQAVRPSATGKRSLAGMAQWISGVYRLRERVELDLIEDPVPEHGERAAHWSILRPGQVVGRTWVDGDVQWLFELT
jgi:hypothetical protein